MDFQGVLSSTHSYLKVHILLWYSSTQKLKHLSIHDNYIILKVASMETSYHDIQPIYEMIFFSLNTSISDSIVAA